VRSGVFARCGGAGAHLKDIKDAHSHVPHTHQFGTLVYAVFFLAAGHVFERRSECPSVYGRKTGVAFTPVIFWTYRWQPGNYPETGFEDEIALLITTNQ